MDVRGEELNRGELELELASPCFPLPPTPTTSTPLHSPTTGPTTMPATRLKPTLPSAVPPIRPRPPKRPTEQHRPPPAPSVAASPAPPATSSGSTSATTSSTMISSALFFRSLNLPNHNRITPSQLESHILAFLNTSADPPVAPAVPAATCWSYLVTGNVVVSVPTPPTPTPLPLPLPIPVPIPTTLAAVTATGPSPPPSSHPPEHHHHHHNPGFSPIALTSALLPHGITTQIFVRPSSALQHILNTCPFDLSARGSKVHVIFFDRRPDPAAVNALRTKVESAGESIWWSADAEGGMGEEVVMWYPDGQAKAKNQLPQVERMLGLKGSQRGFSIVRACANEMKRG